MDLRQIISLTTYCLPNNAAKALDHVLFVWLYRAAKPANRFLTHSSGCARWAYDGVLYAGEQE